MVVELFGRGDLDHGPVESCLVGIFSETADAPVEEARCGGGSRI
jgi:hypothetical protein